MFGKKAGTAAAVLCAMIIAAGCSSVKSGAREGTREGGSVQISANFVDGDILMKNPAAERRGIFGREEKVLRTFLILYRGSATPPSLAQERTCGPQPPQSSGVLDPPRITASK
jgi:hypothetical protein